ncbi:MAG TPA: ABC transporter permease [Silvibacterium sp.]|nr:ABC transporter permease [Silvibacterium sp.]
MMRWLDQLRMRIEMMFRRSRAAGRLDDELQFHLEQQIAENVAAGMSAEEARHAALREFGNPAVLRDQARETWSWNALERILQDVRFAWRQILRAPGFAVVAILTLALGIGANTAVFTLTHALLLRTLPVRDPGELVRLTLDLSAIDKNGHDAPLNLPFLDAIQKQSRSLHDVFAWCVYDFPFKDGNVNGGIHGAIVSGNAFEALGVRPAAGRLLTPADDQAGGGPDGLAAVISYRIWVSRYHADAAVVGRHVTVTDHAVTIVGVAPPGFEGVIAAEHPDIYLPLEFQAVLYGEPAKHDGGRLWLDTFARLNSGVSRGQTAAEMNAIFPGILDAVAPPAVRHLPVNQKPRIQVKSARTGWSKLRSTYTEPLLLLQIMVGAVLLICCANLSGLFLARASARRQEFAIRGALGAGRLRLMRQLFVECLMLALPGALLGVGLAWMAGPWILHMLGNAEAEQAISMQPNPTVLFVTVACAVLCAVLFGMAPAWTASNTSVEMALRSSNPRTSAGSAGLRNLFVPFQVALSLALVVVAALLGTTVTRLLSENSGYRTDNVIFALTDFLRVPQKGEALVGLYRRMAEQIEQRPGVEKASVSAISPFIGWRWSDEFVAVDNPKHAVPVEAMENIITAHYFSALGVPILTGRDLDNSDADRNSCILSQAAARLYFPHTSALGKTLRSVIRRPRTGQPDTFHDYQIVGIAADTKYDSLRESPPPIVYLPLTAGENGQTNGGSNLFFVIHAHSVAAARSAYLGTLHEMAPSSPEIPPVVFSESFRDSVAKERLLSVLSGFFALLGLLLSGIGIYGLLAWNVTRRTTEIGVRMALGATRLKVFVLVMRQVAGLLAIGVLAGGFAAFFAARSIRSFLFEVQPGNPWVFVLSALTLVLVGLVAATLPARRAVSIDPMQALRTE